MVSHDERYEEDDPEAHDTAFHLRRSRKEICTELDERGHIRWKEETETARGHGNGECNVEVKVCQNQFLKRDRRKRAFHFR